ncbi:MAG TPA: alpha/beta hydrolase [Anaerolineales bacterium]|nr:alpha/beta hydrolase [Anaerolineales bacterium]
MQTKTDFNDRSAATEPRAFTTDSVTSKDGTRIGYYQIGHGPGLVLVQGAMGTARNFLDLGQSLGDTFTVHIPDRRGRGLSSALGINYNVQKEVEDLEALLAKTKTSYIFGLSSGALITLRAALHLPAIRKAAIYEPPLFVNGLPVALMKRYDREMAEGRLAAALITAMQATQMGPKLFNAIPRGLLESLTSKMMENEDKNATSGDITMRRLAPTLRQDFQVVAEMNGRLESFGAIRVSVLLLGGSRSPKFLRDDLDALEKILSNAGRVELPGLGHAAAWNYDKQRNPDGSPERVAQELKRFFVGS